MPKRPLTLLSALLCTLCVTAPAHAQASGLRLKSHSEGITLHAGESGLRLQFVSTTPIANQSAAGFDFTSTTSPRNSLRADWPLLAKGLHTTLGLSWSSESRNSMASSSRSSEMNAMPFMGLGWQGGLQQNSRWRLSAEVGTAFTGGSGCSGIPPSCSGAASGFRTYSSGSGLRLNPYVNFGATFRFDQ